ncbi:MAG TPA: glycosyl hydrolase family 18 protein [Bacteroidota bacterium]|nr:glycosyl hydrolase family 18 protein [Bacteroidota bacterium]
MKTFTLLLLLALPVGLLQARPWVSAYYAAWQQGYYPPSAIDFGAMTHIMHFSVEPTSGGNISGTGNGVTPTTASQLITPAHALGVKVLVTIGGAGDDGGFINNTTAANLPIFVSNLVNFAVSNNYDGIDVDWEDISNGTRFDSFVTALRAKMDSVRPGMLLTCAYQDGYESIVAKVQSCFNQINIMTYDMSGAWSGWVTWHNSPIYDGGNRFPSTGGLMPSADGNVNDAVAAGIPLAKLGIGADFYGYRWDGVCAPMEGWSSTPNVTGNIAYSSLKSTYSSNAILWDAGAGAAYISITSPSQHFISLDAPITMPAKATYVKNKGIGGVIIWELGGGYQSSLPAGHRDSLLQAVKLAFMTTVLPITMSSFTATLASNHTVALHWETTSETDVYGFDAQRSSDNSTYQTIGFVPGHGTSLAKHDYSFMDSLPPSGQLFYRIEEVDNSGAQTYSDAITPTVASVAEGTPVAFDLLQNYPNPFNPKTVISGQWTADSKVRLVVYDVLGREVAVLADGHYPAGKYDFSFDGSNLASGVYFYRLVTGNFTAVRKMTLVK